MKRGFYWYQKLYDFTQKSRRKWSLKDVYSSNKQPGQLAWHSAPSQLGQRLNGTDFDDSLHDGLSAVSQLIRFPVDMCHCRKTVMERIIEFLFSGEVTLESTGELDRSQTSVSRKELSHVHKESIRAGTFSLVRLKKYKVLTRSCDIRLNGSIENQLRGFLKKCSGHSGGSNTRKQIRTFVLVGENKLELTLEITLLHYITIKE